MSLYWQDDDPTTSPERWDLTDLARLDDQDYLADEAHRLRRCVDRQEREIADLRRDRCLAHACIVMLALSVGVALLGWTR